MAIGVDLHHAHGGGAGEVRVAREGEDGGVVGGRRAFGRPLNGIPRGGAGDGGAIDRAHGRDGRGGGAGRGDGDDDGGAAVRRRHADAHLLGVERGAHERVGLARGHGTHDGVAVEGQGEHALTVGLNGGQLQRGQLAHVERRVTSDADGDLGVGLGRVGLGVVVHLRPRLRLRPCGRVFGHFAGVGGVDTIPDNLEGSDGAARAVGGRVAAAIAVDADLERLLRAATEHHHVGTLVDRAEAIANGAPRGVTAGGRDGDQLTLRIVRIDGGRTTRAGANRNGRELPEVILTRAVGGKVDIDVIAQRRNLRGNGQGHRTREGITARGVVQIALQIGGGVGSVAIHAIIASNVPSDSNALDGGRCRTRDGTVRVVNEVRRHGTHAAGGRGPVLAEHLDQTSNLSRADLRGVAGRGIPAEAIGVEVDGGDGTRVALAPQIEAVLTDFKVDIVTGGGAADGDLAIPHAAGQAHAIRREGLGKEVIAHPGEVEGEVVVHNDGAGGVREVDRRIGDG